MLKNADDVDVWKHLKDDPAYGFELAKTDPAWQKWANTNYFKTITKVGKDFEVATLNALKDKNSTLWQKLKLNADDYEIFQQVQLKTGNADEYFVADFILVKKEVNQFTGATRLDFDNAIALESKLSEGTALTTRQGQGLTKVQSANTFDVRSVSKAGEFNPEKYQITNTNKIKIQDFIKVWSDDGGKNVANIMSLK